MLERVGFDENFFEIYQNEPRKIVAYGAGKGFREFSSQFPTLDYICDRNAANIEYIDGKRVYNPDVLNDLHEKIYILVCVMDGKAFEDIWSGLQNYKIDAKVVHVFNNIGFGYSYARTTRSYQKKDSSDKMKVNIVCQEGTWIYRKFADRLAQYLENEKIEITVTGDTREDVDINHHIPCLNFRPYPNDTLMITHIDDDKKVQILKKQLEVANMGICMSAETVSKLVEYGVARKKLCYINPAHDNVISPKKYTIGITHRCYDQYDLRKRTTAILDIIEGVEPAYFRFMIMGAGWDEIVAKMRSKGFEVVYYDDFIYDRYVSLMNEIDYYLFIGMDEGSMGYLDAMAAGVGTIVTPQGFHLDTDCNIDYPCVTIKQFRNAFLDLQNKRKEKVKAVEQWTWDSYAHKHLEVWNYILKRKNLNEIYHNQMLYQDGIFSVLLEDCRIEK